MLMVLTGYFLMLLVMTFNVGILISVILGLGFGNLMTRLWLPKSTINPNYQIVSTTYKPAADQCCCNFDEDYYENKEEGVGVNDDDYNTLK